MNLRRPASLLIALLALLALASPAGAGAGTRGEADEPIVVIVGDVTVPKGKVVEGVFVASGDARIAGRVDGDVLVFAGDALVSGTIDGDLTVLDGHATLTRSARVDGDVHYSSQRPTVSALARVSGDVTEEDWTDSLDFDSVLALGGLVVWLAIGFSFLLLGCLLILMAPRAADYFDARSRERIGPLLGIGFAIGLGLPIAVFIALVTVLGIPLAIGILLALGPLWAVAYAISAYVLGRRLLGPPRGRILAFVVGLAILRAVELVPVLGVLVDLGATIFGLGLIGAGIGAAREPKEKAPGDPPPPPPQTPGT